MFLASLWNYITANVDSHYSKLLEQTSVRAAVWFLLIFFTPGWRPICPKVAVTKVPFNDSIYTPTRFYILVYIVQFLPFILINASVQWLKCTEFIQKKFLWKNIGKRQDVASIYKSDFTKNEIILNADEVSNNLLWKYNVKKYVK